MGVRYGAATIVDSAFHETLSQQTSQTLDLEVGKNKSGNSSGVERSRLPFGVALLADIPRLLGALVPCHL